MIHNRGVGTARSSLRTEWSDLIGSEHLYIPSTVFNSMIDTSNYKLPHASRTIGLCLELVNTQLIGWCLELVNTKLIGWLSCFYWRTAHIDYHVTVYRSSL